MARRSHLSWLWVGCALLACGGREARELRDDIQDDDYRKTYARVPGWEQGRAAAQGGPHSGFIDLYINDVMVDAIEHASSSGVVPLQWPEGSIIVKDGWSALSGGDYEYLSFMERRTGGWYWAEFRKGKRRVSSGLNDDTCTGCHAGGDDEVLSFELPPYDQ